MASEPSPKPAGTSSTLRRDKGIRIFSYPKVIYLFPTMIVAIICWIGMLLIHDNTADPTKVPQSASASAPAASAAPGETTTTAVPAKHDRFKTPQNLFAIL